MSFAPCAVDPWLAFCAQDLVRRVCADLCNMDDEAMYFLQVLVENAAFCRFLVRKVPALDAYLDAVFAIVVVWVNDGKLDKRAEFVNRLLGSLYELW